MLRDLRSLGDGRTTALDAWPRGRIYAAEGPSASSGKRVRPRRSRRSSSVSWGTPTSKGCALLTCGISSRAFAVEAEAPVAPSSRVAGRSLPGPRTVLNITSHGSGGVVSAAPVCGNPASAKGTANQGARGLAPFLPRQNAALRCAIGLWRLPGESGFERTVTPGRGAAWTTLERDCYCLTALSARTRPGFDPRFSRITKNATEPAIVDLVWSIQVILALSTVDRQRSARGRPVPELIQSFLDHPSPCI